MKKILAFILACAAGVHAETKTWLGGGTINGLSLAPTGQMDLTGTAILGQNLILPLTVENLSNPGVSANWDLYINNQLVMGVVLRWDAPTGTLRVVTLGTLLSVF